MDRVLDCQSGVDECFLIFNEEFTGPFSWCGTTRFFLWVMKVDSLVIKTNAYLTWPSCRHWQKDPFYLQWSGHYKYDLNCLMEKHRTDGMHTFGKGSILGGVLFLFRGPRGHPYFNFAFLAARLWLDFLPSPVLIRLPIETTGDVFDTTGIGTFLFGLPLLSSFSVVIFQTDSPNITVLVGVVSLLGFPSVVPLQQ